MLTRAPLVIGIGCGGSNVISRLQNRHFETAALNCDDQSLNLAIANLKLEIGHRWFTRGLGSRGNPEIGRRAMETSLHMVQDVIANRKGLVLVAGLGGGTGSGALPVIARSAESLNIPTMACVSMPFRFEGNRRCSQAQEAFSSIKTIVSHLFSIDASELLTMMDRKTTILNAFTALDICMGQAILSYFERVYGISDYSSTSPLLSELAEAQRDFITQHIITWLKDIHGQTIFNVRGSDSVIVVPNDIDLLEKIAVDRSILREVSPRKFEELIAFLYEASGMRIKLTHGSRDHGADIFVWTPGSLFGREFLTVVQLKKYSPLKRVSETTIRDLKGTQFLFDAQRAECITTSDFTKPAKKAAQALSIDLAAYHDLQGKIQQVLKSRPHTGSS